MSLNLVADDYADTRDVAVEDSDPDDVVAIESTFAADFAGGTGPATSSGDHLLWSPGSEAGIVAVINGARQSLEVENEEMDSTAVTDALASAARRGVDVEVCMTADSSYTEALDQIAAAGGHVHLYPDRDGVLYIHEKLVLADAGTASATAVGGIDQFLHQLPGRQPGTRRRPGCRRRAGSAFHPQRRLPERLRRRTGG